MAEHGDMPEATAYLFRWFCELKPSFTYTELHHWSAMTGRRLRGWEVDALMRLDHLRNTA